MENVRILIIDDEKVIREGVERALSKRGYQIAKAEDGNQGLALLKEQHFDIVLTDLMMPGLDGFAVLDWIRENQPRVQVIVITGFATVTKAVTAMKQGAFDFVGKPFTPDYIRVVVDRAIDKLSMRAETEQLREEKNRGLVGYRQIPEPFEIGFQLYGRGGPYNRFGGCCSAPQSCGHQDPGDPDRSGYR